MLHSRVRKYSTRTALPFESMEDRLTMDGAGIGQFDDVIHNAIWNRSLTGEVRQAAALADVPAYGSSRDWHLNAMNAPESWQAGYIGQGIVVAVVDSGIDMDHVDLVDRLWTNPNEVLGNGIDDDDNGFVDDQHGWDFVDQDSRPYDYNNHGTHVAGIIAAARNREGTTGVAYGAELMAIRVLDAAGGGNFNNIAAGIRYAVDNGADIVNLSLIGESARKSIETSLQYARDHNVLVVSAAGNDGAAEPQYPAQYSQRFSNVISVGAFDSGFVRGGFSNRVGSTGAVQVEAPGVGIYSTISGNRYDTWSGTSMAAPMVSGLAALILSANPTLGAEALRSVIVSGATSSVGYSDAIGGINAAVSVAIAISRPQGALIPGDINQDGAVNFSDFLVLSQNFQMAGTLGDLDGDRMVGFSDFLLMSRYFGSAARS